MEDAVANSDRRGINQPAHPRPDVQAAPSLVQYLQFSEVLNFDIHLHTQDTDGSLTLRIHRCGRSSSLRSCRNKVIAFHLTHCDLRQRLLPHAVISQVHGIGKVRNKFGIPIPRIRKCRGFY